MRPTRNFTQSRTSAVKLRGRARAAITHAFDGRHGNTLPAGTDNRRRPVPDILRDPGTPAVRSRVRSDQQPGFGSPAPDLGVTPDTEVGGHGGLRTRPDETVHHDVLGQPLRRLVRIQGDVDLSDPRAARFRVRSDSSSKAASTVVDVDLGGTTFMGSTLVAFLVQINAPRPERPHASIADPVPSDPDRPPGDPDDRLGRARPGAVRVCHRPGPRTRPPAAPDTSHSRERRVRSHPGTPRHHNPGEGPRGLA